MSKSAHKTIHNNSRERLHNIWYLMHYRCNNHKFHEYHNYGGRGIHVCEEWTGVDGYFRFKEWALKNGYDKHLTIDRINVDGNYEPQNCRWITKAKQNTNKRTNVLVEFNGEVKSLAEWSEVYNIPYKTLHRRLKLGWSIENAITRPIRVANHIKQNDG